MLLYQTLAFTMHGEILKSHTKKINLKYHLRYEMKSLNYLMDHILYETFNNILSIYQKKHGENINYNDNTSIKIYVNKIENRNTFKIKTGYYLELLKPETMKLFESTKSKITKDKNGKNVSHLEITEVVLVHFNIVNNNYQQDSRVLYTFVPNKSFGKLLDISTKNFIFLKTFDLEFSYI